MWILEKLPGWCEHSCDWSWWETCGVSDSAFSRSSQRRVRLSQVYLMENASMLWHIVSAWDRFPKHWFWLVWFPGKPVDRAGFLLLGNPSSLPPCIQITQALAREQRPVNCGVEMSPRETRARCHHFRGSWISASCRRVLLCVWRSDLSGWQEWHSTSPWMVPSWQGLSTSPCPLSEGVFQMFFHRDCNQSRSTSSCSWATRTGILLGFLNSTHILQLLKICRRSSSPRNQTCVSCNVSDFFT